MLLVTFPPPIDLVHIGAVNRSAGEFALAPGGYSVYREDPTYVAGLSGDKDWPYVIPGPGDGWAGSRVHEDAIYFGVGKVEAGASVRLVVDFVETQASGPPTLEIVLNGTLIATRRLPRGNGDAAIEGHPEQGKPSQIVVELPAGGLRTGTNRLAIRNVADSWAVFDALRIEATGVEAAGVAPEVRMRALPSMQAVRRTPEGPRQTLRLEATNLGPPVRRRLTVEGTTRAVELPTGTRTVEFEIPPVRIATKVEIHDADGTGATVDVEPVRPWKILLFPHAHVDVGYTDLQANVERDQRRNLFDALRLARESAFNPLGARYRYNIEASWVLDRFLANSTPEEKAQVREGLRRGDLAVTGGYANMLTAAMRPEEMMQDYRYSRRLEDALGIQIDTASQTDVPGVTWGLTTALGEAGIRNLVLMPNTNDHVGGVREAWQDKPFFWVSPSGRETVFVWEILAYGVAHTLRPWDGRRDRVFRSNDPTKGFIDDYIFPTLAKYASSNYPFDLIGIPWSVTDNSPIDGDVPAAVEAWNARYVTPQVAISTLSDGCREFLARYGKQVPRVKGDLSPYWEDGMASTARESAMNRASADRLVQAATLKAMTAPRHYRADEFLDAWRSVLLFTEHTWGAYNSVSEPDAPFVKSQWAVKRAFAEAGDRASRTLLGASSVGKAYDVVNTASWPRTDLVQLTAAQSAGGDRVIDEGGHALRSQRLRTGELAVLVEGLPAFGARRIRCVPGRSLEGPAVRADAKGLSGRGFVVEIDPKSGAIGRWQQGGREFVKRGAGLNSFSRLLGSDLSKLEGATEVGIEAVEPGPLVASVRATSTVPGARRLVQETRVVAGLNRIEIEDTIDKLAVREKEAMHFGFPFDVPRGQVRIDTPWAVVRPELDQIPGANRDFWCTQRFVDVANADYGVTLSSLDAPLVEIGALSGTLIGAGGADVFRAHVEPTQSVTSWVVGNHWTTNYKADQEGPLTFRYALTPHGPYAADAAARFGTGLAQPLLVREAQKPLAAPLLSLSDPGVLVTSLVPSDDGKALIVRLYGSSGEDRRVTLRWRVATVGRTWRTNLTQRPLSPVVGPVLVPGNGVVTLRAELRKP